MDKRTKSEIRDVLMYLKQGELTITDAMGDIVEIIDEYSQRLRRLRRLKDKTSKISTEISK